MKTTLSTILAVIMVLATVLGANATLNGIALLTPEASTNFQGSAATCRAEVNATGIINAPSWNVTFRASTDTSYSTALCTDSVIANTTDTASCTCDTTTLTAGKNSFVAVAYNGTNQINSTATSVVVDNTAPNRVNVKTLLPPKFHSEVTAECDSNDAIYNASVAASGYVINWTMPDGSNITARGVKTNTFLAESFTMVGLYTLTCDVKDSGNNTARDTLSLTVDTDDDEGAVIGVSKPAARNNTMIIAFVGFIVLIAIIGVVVAVATGGKKRGR